ncbi:MAG: pleckstrin/ G-protein interacting- domain protein [Xenococcaceae cyanobacterium]
MQIIDNEQICYCNVIFQNNDRATNLPGVFYQNKLFCKNKFFFKEQRKEALQYGKQKFLEGRGKITYLLTEDSLGLTIWTENSKLQLSKRQTFLDIVHTFNLKDVVARMRNVGGVSIKDRRYRLLLYPKCFVGSEAVEWMSLNLHLSQEQAVRLGQRLIDERFIHHVTDEHPFINSFFFYRFYRDEV